MPPNWIAGTHNEWNLLIHLTVGVIYLLDSDFISLQSLELTSLQRQPEMLEMGVEEISIAVIGSNFTEPFLKLKGEDMGTEAIEVTDWKKKT